MSEVWFLTSGLEGDHASSFRQERWCRVFLECGATIAIFNVRGALSLNEYSFATLDAFGAFRQQAMANAPRVSSVRTGFPARLLRRIKHMGCWTTLTQTD